MKKTLTTLLFVFFAVGITFAQQTTKQQQSTQQSTTPKSKKPVMTFDATTHDFGTFKEVDGPVTCTFTFKNTGDAMLVIHQAVASCGCTTPVYTKEPVKPGATGEIKVTYNGAKKIPGNFEKVVTLRTNTQEEIHRLIIKGTMVGKNQ